MAKYSVDDLYGRGRSFPHGRVRDEHANHRVPSEPSFNTKGESFPGALRNERPQDPEDERDNTPRYAGDRSGRYFNDRRQPGDWVSASNEDATTKPGFDHRAGSWRLDAKASNNWDNSTLDRSDPINRNAVADRPQRYEQDHTQRRPSPFSAAHSPRANLKQRTSDRGK